MLFFYLYNEINMASQHLELAADDEIRAIDSEIEARLASLKLVYPGKEFEVLNSTGGSDGVIFIEKGTRKVYKVKQGWRLLHGEAEARIHYLMSRKGIAPFYYEYHSATEPRDKKSQDSIHDEQKLRMLKEYQYGDDFIIIGQSREKPLFHSILVMELIDFSEKEKLKLSTQQKLSELVRLFIALVELRFLPKDVEIQYDRGTQRCVFIDCAGFAIVDKIDATYVFDVLDRIAKQLIDPQNLQEKQEIFLTKMKILEMFL